jgi:hypothetical protein
MLPDEEIRKPIQLGSIYRNKMPEADGDYLYYRVLSIETKGVVLLPLIRNTPDAKIHGDYADFVPALGAPMFAVTIEEFYSQLCDEPQPAASAMMIVSECNKKEFTRQLQASLARDIANGLKI